MNKVILAAAFTLVSLSPALASSRYDQMYHDNIRPNGHPRPVTIYNAALDACYSQTGLARDAKDTQAFKDCMATHDYRWVYTRPVQDTPSKRATYAIPKGHFIDPDTGLIYYNTGIASICDPPPADVTIHYTSKHGLNCTRTGAAIASRQLRRTPMKKLIVAATFALMSSSPALASHYNIVFHDTLRPAGHHRSLAVAEAASASCFTQTGTSPEAAPTQAYKDCMNTQGFRLLSSKLVKDPPARQAASGIPAGHFIDSDTGMLCQDSGGAAICVPPPDNMTVRYTNKHGLGCTRTGAVSVCSNL